MEFDPEYLARQLPALWRGLRTTVQVSALAMGLSVLLGLLGAVLRHERVPVLGRLVAAYVELIRNTPLLVQMFFIFFGLPELGVTLPLFWAGVVTLTMWAAAFQTENLRGGLKAVAPGHWDAGRALGMRPAPFLVLVALPLAVRVSLPAVLNTCISLLKNSSYLQAIGVAELTFVAVDRISMDFRTTEMMAALLVAYVGLVLLLSAAVGVVERRLQRPFAPA